MLFPLNPTKKIVKKLRMAMAKISRSLLNSLVHQKSLARSFQARCITTDLQPIAGFDQMLSGVQRKYYMLGGKGGVGKTSCAASLAVKFANSGHSTIVVSTDPAHSLSDSFDQDLTGGTLVPVQGVDSPLYALEINPERSREEFRAARKQIDEGGVKNIMDSMGLGKLGEQLGGSQTWRAVGHSSTWS